MRINVTGRAVVTDDAGEVTDVAVLRRLHGIVYDRETFTDHLGNVNVAGFEKSLVSDPNNKVIRKMIQKGELANATRNALLPSGHLRLVYREAANQVWVVTEYEAQRVLSEAELAFLVQYTVGQWSDGIGENFQSVSKELYGVTVDCSEVTEPIVEQTMQ